MLLVVKTLRPKQNGRHFPDDILKRISWIKIAVFWWKFVPQGPINNIPAFGQIMACQVTSRYLNQWWLSLMTHMGHSASVSEIPSLWKPKARLPCMMNSMFADDLGPRLLNWFNLTHWPLEDLTTVSN